MVQYNFATANLSFAFAMGATIGSEAKWLKKILEDVNVKKGEEEAYLKNRAKGVMRDIVIDIDAGKIDAGKIDAIGLQELNESDEYGHEYLVKLLKEKAPGPNKVFHQHERIILKAGKKPESSTPTVTGVSDNAKYCMISLTVEVTNRIKPTIALIYDMEKLGKPVQIECRDFYNIPGNTGRPMLGVRTDKGFVLMVMHAPNVNPFLFDAFKSDHFKPYQQELENYYKKIGELPPNLKEKINEKIKDEFMTPMEHQIKDFINAIKQGKESAKLVLMGDMNDTDPGEEKKGARPSLSNWLQKNVGLDFSVPEYGTCCYNWDSSNSPEKGNPTRWFIGENSHPHTDGKMKVDNVSNDDKKAILAEKAQLKNYDFKGDLIYYSENLVPVGKQRELFPQGNKELTSQYSDHVFQVITLKDKGSSGGGRKRTLKRKGKKTRKRRHKRKMTKRKKMKKRRSRKHRSR